MRPDDKTCRIEDVSCLKATEKALLVLIDGEEHWIPKSHVHDDSEVFDDLNNADGALVISEWIAKQKGIA